MKFIIHYSLKDKLNVMTEDSFVVEGETIEEIQQRSAAELKKRGGLYPWSEELT
jgi:hypothetical protein